MENNNELLNKNNLSEFMVVRELPNRLPLKLYSKLNAIMKEVDVLSKHGFNQDNQYNYLETDAIVSALRPLLDKHNVFIRQPRILKTMVEKVEGGQEHTVLAEYLLIDLDSEEWDSCIMQGVAIDNTGKGFYQALTGAYKYMLMQTFKISSKKDDPEYNPTAYKPADKKNVSEPKDNSQSYDNKKPKLISEGQYDVLVKEKEVLVYLGLTEESLLKITGSQAHKHITSLKKYKQEIRSKKPANQDIPTKNASEQDASHENEDFNSLVKNEGNSEEIESIKETINEENNNISPSVELGSNEGNENTILSVELGSDTDTDTKEAKAPIDNASLNYIKNVLITMVGKKEKLDPEFIEEEIKKQYNKKDLSELIKEEAQEIIKQLQTRNKRS